MSVRSARASVAPALARDEVFIETKVWVSDYGYDETLHAFEKAAGKLGVEQLDLLILHQPAPDRFEKTLAAYQALEALLSDGKVRAIGVSNFMPHHLDRLLAETTVVPAVNQIELHPYFTQHQVQKSDVEHGILTQAWSPIGGITFYPGYGEQRVSVMDDPRLQDLAREHAKTPAQIMLRWHIQQGRSAIPKSTNPGGSRRTSMFSTSTCPPTSSPASTPSTAAYATAPIPTCPVPTSLSASSPKPETTRERRTPRC